VPGDSTQLMLNSNYKKLHGRTHAFTLVREEKKKEKGGRATSPREIQSSRRKKIEGENLASASGAVAGRPSRPREKEGEQVRSRNRTIKETKD